MVTGLRNIQRPRHGADRRKLSKACLKVTREQALQNRDRVLDVAARLFRERGFDGIGVADLMKSAGLTHGGFYGQFGSKEALMAEACTRSFDSALQRWTMVGGQATSNPLAAVMQGYLSQQHRDNPGAGCVIASLGAETSRQGSSLRRAVTDGARDAGPVHIVCTGAHEGGEARARRGGLRQLTVRTRRGSRPLSLARRSQHATSNVHCFDGIV